MAKEFLISLYLLFFKILFNIFKLFPLKKKVTFVVSFKDNGLFVYNEMKKQQIPYNVVFLCEQSCYKEIEQNVNTDVILLNLKNIIPCIYHLATSKQIIIDNYFAFLSSVNFKKNVQCIQLWHAAGAIKTFGLKDKSVSSRPKRALKRFNRVYNQFKKIIVGSDEMAYIFKEAFNVSESNILYTGIPRTDLFFDKKNQYNIRNELIFNNPILKNKKVIFYAPTFRDGELNRFKLHLDIDKLYSAFSKEYVVLIKLHPAIKNNLTLDKKYNGFLFDYSTYDNVNKLLFITDYLITDYSSIPYEFSLLERPMIFFPYDLETYQQQRGFWGPYEDIVPGPIAMNTEEIINIIRSNDFDFERIRTFSLNWNKYSRGNSSENLVRYLFQEEEHAVQKEKFY
ncbi:CDP-glycerol glycerophosphotransferase family protein [Heyndrickxia sporothermodurans]|uniref:CDP-glycerol--glycerophosphate glycerophosphotransferase n=2 Tax=Heyndrickxia sporothermodurans TaxID=46224 RepID=A0A150LB61_9BACI|nr:CDP-glycerol glycerophosphotransferase family protein [Heyndrickxia sporothermodurans]KYD09567.1 hypothetical protein B4102_1965 [Heyndrickxia sporothermodurans]MED3650506.1 CDP-glycerol glycerophosphotransferase family protein [Heyndrickxia sporothermodurans]MED3654401.1 CDP-glycerol glycerophosphotransferase family protein [Heyndrickxia sporothermodurans]MED3697270.1 CDP-glycerol glycerophosphotransferase family protein [Heyndrickxia sporothermodurans]